MPRPQPGLFIEETAHHFHVEWQVHSGVAVDDVILAIAEARRAATFMRSPNTVWGFDPRLWQRILGDDLPATVRPFGGVTGSGGTAPATQRSIWLWAAGNAHEKVWQSARAAASVLAGVADVGSELVAYTPMDDRDPIGFIDGTENPAVDEAIDLTLFPDGAPGAGGTAVLIQKWVHELAAFQALSIADQEAVFGRRRSDSIELPPDAQPPTSHVARNVITDRAGNERHIYRRNTPFATLAETGTLFIGCSNDPSRLDEMLARMFGASEDGLTDHLTRFSTPVSGSYYFAPSMDSLERAFGPLDDDD